MVTRIKQHLSYANVMATIAVFMVLGGGAYAATKLPKNSVGTAQIKNKAVTKAKLAKGVAVKGAKGDKGDKGDTGATGTQGPKGDKGDTGPSTGAAGGDLTGNFPNPAIADNAIGTSKLADGAVAGSKLAPQKYLYWSTTTTTTSIANDSAFHRLDFPATIQHDGIGVTPSPGAVTVGESGRYLVTGWVRWLSTSTTGSFRQLAVSRAGGPSGSQNITNDLVAAGNAANLVQPFQGVVDLQDGDGIRAEAAHDANAAISVLIQMAVVRISG